MIFATLKDHFIVHEESYSACDVIGVIPTLHTSRDGNVSQSVNQLGSRLKYLYIYWED